MTRLEKECAELQSKLEEAKASSQEAQAKSQQLQVEVDDLKQHVGTESEHVGRTNAEQQQHLNQITQESNWYETLIQALGGMAGVELAMDDAQQLLSIAFLMPDQTKKVVELHLDPKLCSITDMHAADKNIYLNDLKKRSSKEQLPLAELVGELVDRVQTCWYRQTEWDDLRRRFVVFMK